MQALFLKLIFFIRKGNAHLHVSQNEKRSVTCGAFCALRNSFIVKKETPFKTNFRWL